MASASEGIALVAPGLTPMGDGVGLGTTGVVVAAEAAAAAEATRACLPFLFFFFFFFFVVCESGSLSEELRAVEFDNSMSLLTFL